MMSGMDMAGMSMGGSGMSSSNMYDGYMLGMDMSGYVVDEPATLFSDPWLLIGWLILGLLVLAILVGLAFGIAWIIRRSRKVQST
jgi:F0F1-type ATP synthase assembly protein I